MASISEMMKLEQNIDIYIDAYLATHPIGTLFDLEKYILAKERENSPRLQSYSDLRIAPLLRHPKVWPSSVWLQNNPSAPKQSLLGYAHLWICCAH